MNKNEVWNLFVAESGGINDADADLFSDASSATGESIQSSKYSSSQSSAFSRSTGYTTLHLRMFGILLS